MSYVSANFQVEKTRLFSLCKLNHIHTLTKMLLGIRNAYLNIDMRNAHSRQAPRHIDLGESSSSWANIRHLSNEERDQIDLQARVILTRCSDRIKEMETLEKRRWLRNLGHA